MPRNFQFIKHAPSAATLQRSVSTQGSKLKIENVKQNLISITSRKYYNHPLPAWVCCQILISAFINPWHRLNKQNACVILENLPISNNMQHWSKSTCDCLFRFVNESKNDDESTFIRHIQMKECPSYIQTNGVRTGCDLDLDGTHILISFRGRRNRTSLNTFRKPVTSNGIMAQYVLSLSTINCRKGVFEKLMTLHDYGIQIAGKAFHILALTFSCWARQQVSVSFSSS